VRVEFGGAFEVLQGDFVLALATVQHAEVEVGLGVFLCVSYGLFEVVDGLLQIPFFTRRQAEFLIGGCKGGIGG
jgi:hypothetical protein